MPGSSGSIADVYHDANHPAGYATPWKLWKATGQTKKEIESYLQGEDAYTLHRQARRKFPRNVTYADNIDDTWQADLTDFRALEHANKGYTFVLFVIDIFSRYGWAVALKDKKANSIVHGFETIFKTTSRRPTRLFTDKGKEFINKRFQQYLKENDVQYYHTNNPDIKCAIVERWQKTLKSKIFKRFTAVENERYVDGLLQKVVHAYNHTYHKSIKMTPAEVTEKRVLEVYKNLYEGVPRTSHRTKFKVGQHVRITREKHCHEKGYTTNWSQEIFQVSQVLRHAVPMYRLQDLDSDPVEGAFYEMELQAVKKPTVFKIAYIVDTRGKGTRKKHLVHWKGYPEKSRSWILDSDLVK